MFYSKPPSYEIPIESIVPGGWGDEFDDDQLASKKDKKIGDSKQPHKEVKGISSDMTLEEIMHVDSFEKQLDKKETCMVKEVIQEVNEKIQY